MNKFKFSLLALMLASGCYLPAAITWDFANVKDRKNWIFNRWAGFLPHPQMEFDEKTMVRPIDEIINGFTQKSNLKTKKIVVFEVIGLAMADNNYDDNERAIISDMENKFGLDKSYGEECEKVIGEYISFQNRINNLVLG